MKLKEIYINNFRGATKPLKLTFDNSKKITMLFGENGNGKSSIADAIVTLCTDRLGSIRDKSSVDHGYVKSLGSNTKDVSIRLVTDAGSYNAQLNPSGTTFTKTPETGAPTARHLRRSQIIHLIDAEASRRYEVLKDYIDVTNIIKGEEELRKAKKTAEGNFKTVLSTLTSAKTTLNNCWIEEGRPGKDCDEWSKAESEKDLTDQKRKQTILNTLVDSWKTVVAQRVEIGRVNMTYKGNLETVKEAKEQIQLLTQQNTSNDFDLLKVLVEAKELLSIKPSISKCPVCEQGIENEKLLGKINTRIKSMEEFQLAKKGLADANKIKESTESTLRTLIGTFIDRLTDFITLLRAELANDDPLLGSLQEILDSNTNNDKYKSLATHFTLIELKVKGFEFAAVKLNKSIFQHNLIKTQFDNLTNSKKQHNKAEKLAIFTSEALSIIENKRKEFIDQELSSISADVENLYQKMHPDESLGGIKLFLKPTVKNSIELNANFYSASSITPQSVYSESHLDTLGICIFLALAKKYNDGNTILILDDVVMSVDENHLDRFIKLLHDETDTFAHILITTHYRPWKDRYKVNRAPVAKVQFVELRGWTLSSGIRLHNSKIDMDELKKALDDEDYDRQIISSKAGIILENILDFISIKYQCKVARKDRNEFVLRELLDCISSKLLKVLKVQHLVKGEDGVYSGSEFILEQELKPIIDNFKQLSPIRNQVGAHFNWDGSTVPDKDIIAFGEAVYEFGKLLICPETGMFPDKNSGSYLETRNGSVRLHPLMEPA
jgi:energy-coupling factor transporter ATP-binding protein EcfA2